MLLIFLFAISAAILLASRIRHHLSAGISNRARIAIREIAGAKERPEPSNFTSPLQRKLFVVVLPDGKVVNPW
jgi:hypothetical protein